MAKRKDIKKQIEEEEGRYYGEEPSEEVKNVDESYKDVVGHEPEEGTIAEEVEEAEEVRRGKKPAHRKEEK